MKKLKGPELKMPDLKVPDFARDLYYDLRDRRLLPLVALVVVAILVVPFLLANGSEPEVHAAGSGAGASPSSTNASELTVVRATPGLRDYRRRFKARSPHDPFKQKFTGPDLSGAQLGSGEESGSGGSSSKTSTIETTTTNSNGTSTVTKETTKSAGSEETTTTKTETEVKESGGETGGNSGSGGQPSEQVMLYSFAIDVKIVRTADNADGSKDTSKPDIRNEVIPPASLPSEKEQVVTYLGISPKTKKPLLLVSDAVTAVYGEASCLSGQSKCQLLEVETGIPTTFVYGEEGVRYKINILKVKPVVRGHF